MARKRVIPKVLEAEQFILCDANGRTRASLSMVGEFPAFQIRDAEGHPRVTIQVEPDGRALIRVENPGGAAVGMSVNDSGQVGLCIFRQGGMPTFDIGCLPDEELRLTVYDKDGRPIDRPFDTKPPKG